MCAACSEPHEIEQCNSFLQLKNAKRWALARKKGLCYICLRASHISSKCKNNKKCPFEDCNKFHHELLHKCSSSKSSIPDDRNTDPIVSLRTLPVIVYNKGKEIVLNALLDDGSSQTFINSDVIKELGIEESIEREVAISVLNSNNELVHTSDVTFEISSLDKLNKSKISAMTAKQVVGDMKATDWNTEKTKFSHLK